MYYSQQSSSDASNEEVESISIYEKYQQRISANEVREVGLQEQQHIEKSNSYASKNINTSKIELNEKSMQCCEGEDDSEFLIALQTRGNSGKHVKKIKRNDINRASLMKFMERSSSLFESLLVEREQGVVLQRDKKLTIAFGRGDTHIGNVNKLLARCTLTYTTCFCQVCNSVVLRCFLL